MVDHRKWVNYMEIICTNWIEIAVHGRFFKFDCTNESQRISCAQPVSGKKNHQTPHHFVTWKRKKKNPKRTKNCQPEIFVSQNSHRLPADCPSICVYRRPVSSVPRRLHYSSDSSWIRCNSPYCTSPNRWQFPCAHLPSILSECMRTTIELVASLSTDFVAYGIDFSLCRPSSAHYWYCFGCRWHCYWIRLCGRRTNRHHSASSVDFSHKAATPDSNFSHFFHSSSMRIYCSLRPQRQYWIVGNWISCGHKWSCCCYCNDSHWNCLCNSIWPNWRSSLDRWPFERVTLANGTWAARVASQYPKIVCPITLMAFAMAATNSSPCSNCRSGCRLLRSPFCRIFVRFFYLFTRIQKLNVCV